MIAFCLTSSSRSISRDDIKWYASNMLLFIWNMEIMQANTFLRGKNWSKVIYWFSHKKPPSDGNQQAHCRFYGAHTKLTDIRSHIKRFLFEKYNDSIYVDCFTASKNIWSIKIGLESAECSGWWHRNRKT